MMLIAQGMPIPYAERAAAAQQLEKLREHLRSYPRCNSEQVETLLHRVTEDAVDRLGGLDFYVGSNGLLLTASFLQVLASPRLNIVRHPKVWSAPKPGFFGPMWDEQHNPAMCTNDLTDYVGSVLPALLSFADGEMLSKSGKVSFSELKMKELMPLWSILEGAMDRKAATLSLTIAVQAMLLSIVCVNGGGRCMEVQRTTRAAFSTAFKQIDRDYLHGVQADYLASTEVERRAIRTVRSTGATWRCCGLMSISPTDATNRLHSLNWRRFP